MQGQEITFIGNRASSITTLALAAAVGALGVWALLFDHPVLGVVILGAAVVGAVVSLPVAVSPRSRYLRLDSDGFEVASRRDKDRVSWSDVAEFRWGLHNDAKVIEIEYVPEYGRRNGVSAAGNGSATGRIFDRYNAPLTDILDSLIEWRTRFGPQR
jgi:hypothetical protein